MMTYKKYEFKLLKEEGFLTEYKYGEKKGNRSRSK